MIKTIILALAILSVSFCTLGVVADISKEEAAAAFQCIAKAGYQDATINILSSPTGIAVDEAGTRNLIKAKNSFIKVSIGFYSCRGRDPIEQVDEFVRKISKDIYHQVWVYLGRYDLWPQCVPQSFNLQRNCNYMHQILSQFKKYGVTAGIASEESKWNNQFSNYCDDLCIYPLYWTPQPDKNPSFSNFKPFGGWTSPAVKIYQQQARVCGTQLNLSYRP